MNNLVVKNIDQSFSGQHILHSISVTALAGAVTVFLGPNGAGKTTLLKSIIGLYPITHNTQASITLGNSNLTNAPVHQRIAAGLLYVPQQTSLFQQMSVEQNLLLVFQHHAYWQSKDRAQFETEMNLLLEKTALTQTLHKMVKHLSGGQKRKVEVVRALLMNPQAILFDEPFAGVDPKSIYELKNLFTQMAEKKIAVIISDHHVDQLLSIASTVYVVMKGKIVTSGTIEQVMQDKQLKERYLGSQFHAEVSKKYLS